jgi:cytochrome c oxidase subunit 4
MSHQDTAYHPHVISVQTNLIVFAGLMLLLVLTIGVAFLDLGPLGLAIALLIAAVKAVLIVLYFMHVRFGSRLQWLFSGAAFLWLALLLLITLSDYLSRGWTNVLGK